MPTNNILPFCATDTGTNLLTQAEYIAATDRTSGNKAGVASSKLNNKAIRQSAFMVSQLAQYISDRIGADVLDDGNTATLLANIKRAYSGTIINVAAKTTTYTIANTDDLVTGSAGGGAFTMTLPDNASNPGKIFRLAKIDSGANAVTIARAGSDTIDGATTYVLGAQYESVVLVSSGTGLWLVF